MILLFLLLMTVSQLSFADIFSKPTNQGQFNKALANDSKNFYLRSGFDYNAYAPSQSPYQLDKGGVSLGYSRYNSHESLKTLLTRSEFNTAELELLMQRLSTSRFLVWQYSSPTLADLYKHLDTIGHLQLSLRYHQFENLERTIDDPLVKLRKQAVMDCLKRQGDDYADDVDLAFQTCLDRLNAQTKPYSSLEDPGNGNFNISGTVNVTDKALDRVNKVEEDLTVIKQIIPRVMVTHDEVSIQGPLHKSRELISQYRGEFLSNLEDIMSEYKQNKTVNLQKLSNLSVFGVPLTEGQIRNLFMLNDVTAYLSINKIASELAYLKTIDQYLEASQMLDKVMSHPAIEPGYKTLLRSSSEFIYKEISALKEEKERLSQYSNTMYSILDESDKERLKSLSWIKQESISEAKEGLLNINP